jgi:N-acetylmuramoyl-L-alanine amidase
LRNRTILIDVDASKKIGGARLYSNAKRIKEVLNRDGYKSFFACSENTSPFLLDRVQLAKQVHADLLLLVRCDGVRLTSLFENNKVSDDIKNEKYLFLKGDSERVLSTIAMRFLDEKQVQEKEEIQHLRTLLARFSIS